MPYKNGIAQGIEDAGSSFAQAIKDGRLIEQAEKDKKRQQFLKNIENSIDFGIIKDKQELALTIAGNKQKLGITDQEVQALGIKIEGQRIQEHQKQQALGGFADSFQGTGKEQLTSGLSLGLSPSQITESKKIVTGESGDKAKALADYQKALINSSPKDYEKIHKLFEKKVGFRISAFDKTRDGSEASADLNALSDDFQRLMAPSGLSGIVMRQANPEGYKSALTVLKRRIIDYERRYGTKVRQWFGFTDQDMKDPNAEPSKIIPKGKSGKALEEMTTEELLKELNK